MLFTHKAVRSFVLIASCLLANAVAAMTWAELEREIESVEAGNAGNPQLIQRTAEMIEMLAVYAKAQAAAELPRLFCPEPNRQIQLDGVVSMIRAQARAENAGPATSVQQLLLNSFRANYPC